MLTTVTGSKPRRYAAVIERINLTSAEPNRNLLLRITDPEFRTGVLEDFGLAWIVLSVMDALIVAFAPVFVVAGQGMAFALVLLAASVAALVLCKVMFGRRAVE